MEKLILDACCGQRSFWFDKNNPLVEFVDIRDIEYNINDKIVKIHPDRLADFRNLPYNDNTFNLVVFDPPHLKQNVDGIMTKIYGKLGENWKDDIAKGFKECYRVLKPNGIMVFKWSEHDIKLNRVLELFDEKPLFGHRTKAGGTIWCCFMKIK